MGDEGGAHGEVYAHDGASAGRTEQYRQLLDAVDDGIYQLDPEGRFVTVNDVVTDITGYDRDDLLGSHVSMVIDEVDVARIEAMIHAMLTHDLDGRPVDIPVETRDGEVHPVEIRVSVLEDDGQFQGTVGVVRDVSRRSGQDPTVTAVTGRYESLVKDVLDGAGVGVTVIDDDGRVTWINEATETYFGVDRSRVIGRDEAVVLDQFREAVVDQTAFREAHGAAEDGAEFQIVPDADREHRWVVHRSNPIETGRYAGGRVDLYYDVTARKQSEQVAREREQRLAEEQAFAESLLDAQPDIVYALDTEGRPLRWNDRVSEVTGYTDAEIAWMTATDFVADEAEGAAIDAVAQICEAGESATVELPLETADSEKIPYQFSSTPLTDEDGEVVGLTGVGRDISQLKAQAKRLERQRDDLEAELSEVFDRIDDAFVALNDDFRFTYVNDRAEELLDSTSADIVGATVHDVDYVTADVAAAVERAFAEQVQVTVEDYVPGSDAWIESHVYPSETGVSVYFCDVTERERRKQALESQRERLAALDDLNGVVRNVTDAVLDQSTREQIETAVVEGIVASDSYAAAWIGAADPGSESVRIGATAGYDGSVGGTWIPIEPSRERHDQPASAAVRTRELQVCRESDDRAPPPGADGDSDLRSTAAIPIVHGETLYGVLTVETERERAFSDEEREVVGQVGEIVGHAIAAIERKRALTSDEVIEAEFGVENPFADVAGVDAPDGIAFEQAVPVGDERYHVYGTATDEGMATLEALAAADPTITDLRPISTENGLSSFELSQREPPLAVVLATHGATVASAVVEDGTYHLTVRFPPGVEVRTVKDAVTEVYPGAALLAQRQVRRPNDGANQVISALESELTDRQRAVLQAAYFGGYFEWPRGSTGEEIAEALDIAPATFSQHLRTAQRRLFAVLLDGESAVFD